MSLSKLQTSIASHYPSAQPSEAITTPDTCWPDALSLSISLPLTLTHISRNRELPFTLTHGLLHDTHMSQHTHTHTKHHTHTTHPTPTPHTHTNTHTHTHTNTAVLCSRLISSLTGWPLG